MLIQARQTDRQLILHKRLPQINITFSAKWITIPIQKVDICMSHWVVPDCMLNVCYTVSFCKRHYSIHQKGPFQFLSSPHFYISASITGSRNMKTDRTEWQWSGANESSLERSCRLAGAVLLMLEGVSSRKLASIPSSGSNSSTLLTGTDELLTARCKSDKNTMWYSLPFSQTSDQEASLMSE